MKRELPARASLEYLRKSAKELLRTLRQERPAAKLGEAQHLLALEYGFAGWRHLKDHVENARAALALPFFAACDSGDVAQVARLLSADATLAHERHVHLGRTALHRAALARRIDVVRLLLERGADPNARDHGDHAYAHHFAASLGELGIVRACLDAGGDVHGEGDVHLMGVIGWALCLDAPRAEVAALLLERGARHHVFSAVAAREHDVIQSLVEANAAVLDQRMSRFEHAATPLHFAARSADAATLELLLDLGAALEATDDRGRTPLAAALLAGNQATALALRRAGAKEPARPVTSSFEYATPILPVADLQRSLAYYEQQLGFQKAWEAGAPPTFACVRHDDVGLFLSQGSYHGTAGVWVFIDVENVDARTSNTSRAARPSRSLRRTNRGARARCTSWIPTATTCGSRATSSAEPEPRSAWRGRVPARGRAQPRVLVEGDSWVKYDAIALNPTPANLFLSTCE